MRNIRWLTLPPLLLGLIAQLGAGPQPGVEKAEIKVTVRAEQLAAATARFALNKANAEQRLVTFYDTRSLDLFRSGIVLRTRKMMPGKDDSTAKLRPIDPSRIAAVWFAKAGFKCEEDWSAGASVAACSFSHEQGKGEIDEVAAGKRAIEKLFSAEQELFVSTYAKSAPDYAKLSALGPVQAWVWELRRPDFAEKLTVERWELPDGSAVLEISTRVPITTAAATQQTFFTYLEGMGLETRSREDSKTRTALEYFIKK